MKTSSAKAKGRRLCQKVKTLLLKAFPQLLEDDVQVTSSSAGGEDLKLSPMAQNFIPFSFECKNQERLNIWSAIDQAKKNSQGRHPAVIFSKNRDETYIAIDFELFLNILIRD